MQEIILGETAGPELSLLYANKNYEDILLKDELDKFHDDGDAYVTYVLEHHDTMWEGPEGVVTKDLILEALPMPSEDHLVLHCGQPKMNELVRGLLLEVGHKEENIFQY